MMRNWSKTIPFFLPFALAGCAKMKDMFMGPLNPPGYEAVASNVKVQRVMLVSSPEANDGDAIRVHMVVAYNLQVAQMLLKLSSAEYFGSLNALKKDYHGMFDVIEWNIVPGKPVPQTKNLKQIASLNLDKAVGGYFFARYSHPKGSHRLKIPEYVQIRVHLDEKGMQLIDPENTDQET